MKEWIIAVRPWSTPASAMPIIATLAFLFWKGAEINWIYGVWALAGMILFHYAGNVWSDWFDYRKKVDADDTFGAKTLTTGMFTPKEIMGLAISAGSRPTFLASSGSVQPMDLAISTVQNMATDTMTVTFMVSGVTPAVK